jgi:hypothetical protein
MLLLLLHLQLLQLQHSHQQTCSPPDLGLKAHVQHAISLIQCQVVDGCQALLVTNK